MERGLRRCASGCSMNLVALFCWELTSLGRGTAARCRGIHAKRQWSNLSTRTTQTTTTSTTTTKRSRHNFGKAGEVRVGYFRDCTFRIAFAGKHSRLLEDSFGPIATVVRVPATSTASSATICHLYVQRHTSRSNTFCR